MTSLRQSPSLAMPVALLAIWLLTHRYFGIQHDGIYYAAQALARLDPSAFAHDLFFQFGSQADYSLFGAIHAFFVSRLGLGTAAPLLLVVGHLAWMLSAWAVARQWLKGAGVVIALGLIFALPGHYGAQVGQANDILRYAESFLTARSWAEPAVLASLAASFAGHHRLAVAACAVGLLCHPLMGLAGIVFLAAHTCRPSWRTLLTLAALSIPLAFLLPEMDEAWRTEALWRAPYLSFANWSPAELAGPFVWIGILLTAALDHDQRIRQGARAIALTGMAGGWLALLASTSHAALLIQIQPWRCLWLLKIVGLLALCRMFATRWQKSAADRWLLAGFAASAITAETLGGPIALGLTAIAHLAWRNGPPRTLPRWMPIAGSLALTLIVTESVLAVLQQVVALSATFQAAVFRGDRAAFFQGPLALMLPAAIALLLHLDRSRPRLALVLAGTGLAIAASGWYRAGDPLQQAYFSERTERPFGDAIHTSDTVYWQNSATHAWFLLRQGNYASRLQSASGVFFRPAAMESIRRLHAISDLDAADGDPVSNGGTLTPTRTRLARFCDQSLLDVVILSSPIDGTPVPAWFDPLRNASWFLYRCADFRSQAGVPSHLLPSEGEESAIAIIRHMTKPGKQVGTRT